MERGGGGECRLIAWPTMHHVPAYASLATKDGLFARECKENVRNIGHARFFFFICPMPRLFVLALLAGAIDFFGAAKSKSVSA